MFRGDFMQPVKLDVANNGRLGRRGIHDGQKEQKSDHRDKTREQAVLLLCLLTGDRSDDR